MAMDFPCPESPGTDTEQPKSEQPLLVCMQVLEFHYEHGGIDKKGYDVLARMIQMMSAIGWEIHLIFRSKIVWTGSLANMEMYANYLRQGCEVFCASMKAAISETLRIDEALPEFVEGQSALEVALEQWHEGLNSVHEPTGHDQRLFESILNHYDGVAYQRLLQLDARKPHYGLSGVVESARGVYTALNELHLLARRADELVLNLRQRFKTAIARLQVRCAQQKAPTTDHDEDRPLDLPVLPATVYSSPRTQSSTRHNLHISKSFGFAEEEIAHRGHARAATFSDMSYKAAESAGGIGQAITTDSVQEKTLGTRHKGTSVPRIFTGSFSQLESDLRKLHIDKVETPITLDIDREDPIKVRDFGATPAASPGRTPSPTPLQRREALVSREVEIQARVINGEVVKSRRPSTKTRAQTVDERTGSLEAWLSEERPKDDSPKQCVSGVRRGSLRHRENTL